MFTLTMKTDNAAFAESILEDGAAEVIDILERVGKALLKGKRDGFCMDSNGNKVGQWELNGD